MKAKKSPESTVSGCEFLKRDSGVSGKWRRKLLCALVCGCGPAEMAEVKCEGCWDPGERESASDSKK